MKSIAPPASAASGRLVSLPPVCSYRFIMSKPKPQFWKIRSLAELTQEEWESLCDGCGRCCLVKLEDEETGEIFFTDAACRLLDRHSCRCTDYEQRLDKVPDCLALGMEHPEYFAMLPPSCAYRRLHEGRELAPWHPLVSGNRGSVHRAGISVRGNCIPEDQVDPDELETRIIEFFDEQ